MPQTKPRDIIVPIDSDDLARLIKIEIEEYGPHCSLNHIDVSQLDCLGLPFGYEFNGDISQWDVSNVVSLDMLFSHSKFNGDISKWNVSKCAHFSGMFANSQFNGDISNWNVRNATCLSQMFSKSQFVGDISNWDTSNVWGMAGMFEECPFTGDLSRWNTSSVRDMSSMFKGSPFDGNIASWDVSRVIDMSKMFESSPFNQNISQWNVQNVISMHRMFANSQFNGDIFTWKPVSIGNVEDNKRYSWEDAIDDARALPAQQRHAIATFTNDHTGMLEFRRLATCAEMFADAKFTSDVSHWPLPVHIHHADMFKNNPHGWANQGISPWTLHQHMHNKTIPSHALWAERVQQYQQTHAHLAPSHATCELLKEHAPQWYPQPKPVRVETPLELHKHVRQEMAQRGSSVDLNHLDVSGIKSLDGLFRGKNFTGDISRWDVSNIITMTDMFKDSTFNGDLSNWDVGAVCDTSSMFENSPFAGDISRWDVRRFVFADWMFKNTPFDGDLSNWRPRRLVSTKGMFQSCPFNGDIGQWRMSNIGDLSTSLACTLDLYGFDWTADGFTAFMQTKVGQEEHYYTKKIINIDPLRLSAASMFEDSGFAHDVSGWACKPQARMDNMFKNNAKGWNAQSVVLWTLELMLRDNLPAPSPDWNEFLTPIREMLQSLHDTPRAQAEHAMELFVARHPSGNEWSSDVADFSF